MSDSTKPKDILLLIRKMPNLKLSKDLKNKVLKLVTVISLSKKLKVMH